MSALLGLILYPVIAVVVGFIILLFITVLYHRYTEGEAGSKTRLLCVLFSSGYSLSAVLYYYLYIKSRLPPSLVIQLLFDSIVVITMVLLIYEMYRRVSLITRYCTESFEDSVRGLEFTVCNSPVCNARYDRLGNRFYITESFYSILSEDEVYAVMLHEVGHKSDTPILLIPFATWTAIVGVQVASCAILVVLAIMELHAFLPVLAITVVALQILKSIIGIFAILDNWIREHECDLNALREGGSKPLVSAIIKTHMCNSISSYSQSIKKIEADPGKLEKPARITYSQLLKTLLKHSYANPLNYTHPPVELRIYKIINEQKHLEQK